MTRDINDIFDDIFGLPGTYKRYKSDRATLKLHIRDAFLDFLLWPLQFLPWGHLASHFWFYALTEKFHSALDGMAFSYFNDAYVLGIREAIKGKRINYKVEVEKELVFKPYIYRPRYPLWLLTKLVIPQFKAIYTAHKENFK